MGNMVRATNMNCSELDDGLGRLILLRHPDKPHGDKLDGIATQIRAVAQQLARLEEFQNRKAEGPCLEHCYNDLNAVNPEQHDDHGGLSEDELDERLMQIKAMIPPPPPAIPAFPIARFGHVVLRALLVDGRPVYDVEWEYKLVPVIRYRYYPQSHRLVELTTSYEAVSGEMEARNAAAARGEDFQAAKVAWFGQMRVALDIPVPASAPPPPPTARSAFLDLC
ncbi:MAG: hypothetical protein CL678_00405 [Bdellovibrionaceae bacterium]|nr:hypothetical protein [Pseudobdellovibrionaceae bacterium]